MKLPTWVVLPTGWIREDRLLLKLRWTAIPGEGANNLAALMTLIVIAQHADENGGTNATYDLLCNATGLSRAKISAGLKVLCTHGIIERLKDRSSFLLSSYDRTKGWGKLPAKKLYSAANRILFFSNMTLRRPAELHALKLYLLFVAMRNNNTNLANISYDRIEEYSGVERHKIKPALSILAANGVVHIEHTAAFGDYGVANAYRVAFIDDRQHYGTTLRGALGEQVRANEDS